MCDHHTGHADLLDDIDQFELGLFAQFFVQSTQWFVKQQDFGPFGQAARQRHALLLPTRKLVRFTFGVGSKLHQIKHLAHPLLDVGLGQALAFEAKRHVLPDVQMWKQRITLEHHVEGPLIRCQTGNILPAEQYPPRTWPLKTREHTQQG